jgi:hypothetical protein
MPRPHTSRRAETLLKEARRIQARSPGSQLENLWHTLNLLELTPAERLRRCLIRGRVGKRATNRAKDRTILPALEDALRVIESRRGTRRAKRKRSTR